MFEDVKNEIIEYGRIAGIKNLSPGISGNMSFRCGDKIIITSSGSANGYLNLSDLVVIDFEGNLVEGNKKPSSERFLHIEYYRQRDDINSILHFHSPYLTAFASSGCDLSDGISPEIIYCFGKIPLAEYAIPGSDELVKNTSVYFKDYDMILMANHGVISGGRDIRQTYLQIELAEAYAKTILFAKLLGGAKILPEDEVKKIYNLK